MLKLVVHFLAAIALGLVSIPFSLWALHPYSPIAETLKVNKLEVVFASALALVISAAIWWRLRRGNTIKEEKQNFIDAMCDDDGVS